MSRRFVFRFSYLGLCAALLAFSATSASAEPAPGDACTPLTAGTTTLSAGPEDAGEGYRLVCDGSAWKSIIEFVEGDGRVRLNFGNDQTACGSAKTGRLRYDDADDLWEYCDGVVWKPLGDAPPFTAIFTPSPTPPGDAELTVAVTEGVGTLSSNVAVDLVGPGLSASGTILSGTQVESHIFSIYRANPSASVATYDITVTFEREILGVAYLTGSLSSSKGVLDSSGGFSTENPGGQLNVGTNDFPIDFDPTRRVMTITGGEVATGGDTFRVLTAAP